MSVRAATERCNKALLRTTSVHARNRERQEGLAIHNLNRRRRYPKLVRWPGGLRDVVRCVVAQTVYCRRRVSGNVAHHNLRADHGTSGAERHPARRFRLDEEVGLGVCDRPVQDEARA